MGLIGGDAITRYRDAFGLYPLVFLMGCAFVLLLWREELACKRWVKRYHLDIPEWVLVTPFLNVCWVSYKLTKINPNI